MRPRSPGGNTPPMPSFGACLGGGSVERSTKCMYMCVDASRRRFSPQSLCRSLVQMEIFDAWPPVRSHHFRYYLAHHAPLPQFVPLPHMAVTLWVHFHHHGNHFREGWCIYTWREPCAQQAPLHDDVPLPFRQRRFRHPHLLQPPSWEVPTLTLLVPDGVYCRPSLWLNGHFDPTIYV